MPARPTPRDPDAPFLRIAFLVYRGNPHCGGQGVYTRHLSRALVERGHEVTVFAGQPYPDLEDGVELVRIPSLDLYRDPDPFRVPKKREVSSAVDVLELATMFTGGFPEPRTFSLRARAELRSRRGDFDLVHDDQSLGTGLLGMRRDGWPVIASIHHPIAVDLELELEHAPTRKKRGSLKRWYRFIAMQDRVARELDSIITVSQNSKRDITRLIGVSPEKIAVVPIGVDATIFRPLPGTTRVRGRIMTTASADVPLKGLIPLLEALAKLRTEREGVHLVVVGSLRPESPVRRVIDQFDLNRSVRFVANLSERELVELYASAEVAVVPSLYEGFSLPAIEAMATSTPLVATTAGALPEVTGASGGAAISVAPDDPSALAGAIGQLLDDRARATAIGAAGRARVLECFTWQAAAAGTEARYRELLRALAC
jgi:glycosyltransferase involved in cell wall biosynthesis